MARFIGWPVALAVTLVVTVGSVLAFVSLRNEREYARLVVAGDAALAAADLSGAIEAYTGAITLNPDSMAAHLKRGVAYRQRNEPEAALRDLRRASELDATAPRVFEWQGDVNLGLGRYARAAERFEQCLALDDRQADVYYKLAVARYREGRTGAAIDPLRRAIALAPTRPEPHYLLGLSLRDAGRFDEALDALATATKLSPALLDAREARAGVLQVRGQVTRAVDELEALAALEPERPDRAIAVGAAYDRAGRHESAVLALGRAAERFPTAPAVFTALGRVWLRTAEADADTVALDKALAALTHAAGLAEPDADTLMLLGRARLRAGDLAAAERDLRAAMARVPAPPEAYATLGDVLVRKARPLEARDVLVQYAALVAGTPAAGAVAPKIGELSMKVGDPHGAVYWYERAIVDLGPSAALLHLQAQAEVSRGREERAETLIAAGLALEPAHPGLLALKRSLAARR